MTHDEPIIAQEEVTPEHIPKEEYVRLAADFENYKRRMNSEMVEIAKWGARSSIEQLLDVLDHMQQAMAHVPEGTDPQWLRGLQQVRQQFEASLQLAGVNRIETQGKVFDPAIMEAVAMVPGGTSQEVKEEVRAGYRMHERVVRPARVVVYQ